MGYWIFAQCRCDHTIIHSMAKYGSARAKDKDYCITILAEAPCPDCQKNIKVHNFYVVDLTIKIHELDGKDPEYDTKKDELMIEPQKSKLYKEEARKTIGATNTEYNDRKLHKHNFQRLPDFDEEEIKKWRPAVSAHAIFSEGDSGTEEEIAKRLKRKDHDGRPRLRDILS
ncbi:MAG: hypothetical protein MMC23_007151 [Stictis urceolatum]|nr:hypothetical protein [Stictis urceolata]